MSLNFRSNFECCNSSKGEVGDEEAADTVETDNFFERIAAEYRTLLVWTLLLHTAAVEMASLDTVLLPVVQSN